MNISPDHLSKENRPIVLFLLCLLCTIQVLWVLKGPNPLLEGGILDPDSYMRLNRVHHLIESGEWFSSYYPRSNAPFGEKQHWTRPLDAILLLGAGLATPFVSFQTALHVWGVFISPVFHLLALLGVLWLVRPVFDRDGQLLVGGVFLFQPGLMTYFLAGRPDHHSLLIVCVVVLLGLTLRMAMSPVNRRVCMGAGVVTGLAIWVSVETFVALAVCLGVLTWGWVRSGDSWSDRNRLMTGTLWVVATAALLIERGWEQCLTPEYDRYSIVHWSVLSGLALFWVGVSGMSNTMRLVSTPIRRILLGIGGGTLIAGLEWLMFPKFFYGPLVDTDPRIISMVWERVTETQPLISTNPWQFGRVIFNLGIALPAIPYLAWMLWSERDPLRHTFWLMVGFGVLLYVPLAMNEMRWVPYAELLVILPYTHWMGQILRRMARHLESPWRDAVKIGVVLVSSMWFLLAGSKLMAMERSIVGGTTSEHCPLIPLSAYLRDPENWGARERTILAFIDFGPELLYRTPHRVVVTPYHRNTDGILDSHRIMSSTDDQDAQGLLKKRQVDLILVCQTSPTEASFYDQSKGTLYERLRMGNPPSWLRTVPLPPHLSPHFSLFEVLGSSGTPEPA